MDTQNLDLEAGPAREMQVASEMVAAQAVAEQLIAHLEDFEVEAGSIFHVRLALDEALANAVKHGNRLDPSKRVTLRYSISHERVVISIEDEGEGFSVASVADPTDNENLDKPGGRGLLMMRSFMTQISYNDSGNCVTLVKDF